MSHLFQFEFSLIYLLSATAKKTKPQAIGGLADDWDKFYAEYIPENYTSDSDYVSTGSFDPASEPAPSEPSSRPSSRASMDVDDIEEDQEDNAAAVDLIGENNQGVQFGGFEPQDPIVQPAVRFLLSLPLYNHIYSSLGS